MSAAQVDTTSDGPGFGVREQIDAIRVATDRFLRNMTAAGIEAPVPTCPDWTVADLARHLGMVHRWAAHIVAERITDFADIRDDYAPAGDDEDLAVLTDWVAQGSADLQATLAAAPDDVAALVFVKSAPPPRQFWARRQTHETTIHAIDALAARLGRIPTAKEAEVPTELAVNGLEELLVGFLQRKSSSMRTQAPLTFLVAPTDSEESWTVRLSSDPPVTVHGADPGADPDAVITGTAATLYLGLWNRGDEISVTGVTELLGVGRG
jgi:uncharacterized protein (TIGR03083 family)